MGCAHSIARSLSFEDVEAFIASGQQDVGWVRQELRSVALPDKRLNERLMRLAELKGMSPMSPIPEACGAWSQAKGAYRFFDNERVEARAILAPHVHETIERMKSHRTVLAVQDTCFFSFASATTYGQTRKTEGLGPIGKGLGGGRGLTMHHCLALTTSGVPLGVLSQNIYARKEVPDESMRDKILRVKYTPNEEKESSKWLVTLREASELFPAGVKVVTVGDRESDFFEFIEEARRLRAPFLIRGHWDRSVDPEDSEGCESLLEVVTSAPVCGTLMVTLTGNGRRAPRTAEVEVRFATATIKPPYRPGRSKLSTDLEPIPLNAVAVTEINLPDGEDALAWVLLTDQPVRNFDEAREKISWYTTRWGIEVFHKIIKSGCKVEACRLETGARLTRFITLCSIIAFRLMHMTYIARATPDAPCAEILSADEAEALCIRSRKLESLRNGSLTAREAVRAIAKLGGFLGRKSDGEPGITTLWRGMQRLNEDVEMLRAFKTSIIR